VASDAVASAMRLLTKLKTSEQENFVSGGNSQSVNLATFNS